LLPWQRPVKPAWQPVKFLWMSATSAGHQHRSARSLLVLGGECAPARNSTSSVIKFLDLKKSASSRNKRGPRSKHGGHVTTFSPAAGGPVIRGILIVTWCVRVFSLLLKRDSSIHLLCDVCCIALINELIIPSKLDNNNNNNNENSIAFNYLG